MPMSGILTSGISWKAAFIFYGIMGLIWYCFWLWLTFEKPRYHPAISIQEMKYIEKSLGDSVKLQMPTIATTPWYEISRSMPVYAIIVANFCRSWNFYLLVLYQSKYLKHKFKYEIAEVSEKLKIMQSIWINAFIFPLSGWNSRCTASFVDDNHCPNWRNVGWSFAQEWHNVNNKCPKSIQLWWLWTRGSVFLSRCPCINWSKFIKDSLLISITNLLVVSW